MVTQSPTLHIFTVTPPGHPGEWDGLEIYGPKIYGVRTEEEDRETWEKGPLE